jgi:hypothetical protein
MIIVLLVIVVLIAIGAIIYVNLPSKNKSKSDNLVSNPILTIKYNDTEFVYSLSSLIQLEQYSGSGRYIKTKLLPDNIVLGDVYNFTGIRVQILLENFDNLPTNYTLNVTASDGYATIYSRNDVWGYVDVYDENGTIKDNQSAVMLLSYMEDGEYYTEIDPNNEFGPFRIVYIGDNVPITSSALWSKMVTFIQIRELL